MKFECTSTPTSKLNETLEWNECSLKCTSTPTSKLNETLEWNE